MSLWRYRMALFAVLMCGYDISRDIPSVWANLGGFFFVYFAIVFALRFSYKQGLKDGEAEYARRPIIQPPPPGWFLDLGPTKREGDRS